MGEAMRAVIQRVQSASVVVDEQTVGAIDVGLLILLGIAPDDTQQAVDWMVKKAQLRIFPDPSGKMILSVSDIGGALLVVSQFTLYGDCHQGAGDQISWALLDPSWPSLWLNLSDRPVGLGCPLKVVSLGPTWMSHCAMMAQ